MIGRFLTLFFIGAVLLGTAVTSVAATLTAEQTEFFEKRVRPVLAEHCYECHSAAKKIKGGLALDFRESTLAGGDSGPGVVPGKPDASKIIEAVRYKNRDLQMPPKRALSATQIADLEQWVVMGAPDPREAKPLAVAKHEAKPAMTVEEGRKFWSFLPIGAPAVPSVKRADWVRTPVDAFILDSLEKAGLGPSQPADARTLIRRASFDLIGLPPSAEEVEAFVAAHARQPEQAMSDLIERLLASPAYGERWGRHWLDVARYADSNGLDENVAFGHAWRYRDYVVRAFNSDKPFDTFLIEQLAGDLMPAADESTRVEQLTGLGFLALGARVLAEPDVQKMEMDVIDEQMDTLGKAFLGMTFGCCRCHDHKFDPMPTADYYAMAAIFRSTRSLSSDRTGAIKYWWEHSLATPEQLAAKKAHEARTAELNGKARALSTKLRNQLKAELQGQAADYLAAAAELPDDADYAAVQTLAAREKLRPRYLLTCRQYLGRNTEHPVFAAWHRLAAKGDAKAVRAHYQALFTEVAAAVSAASAKPKTIAAASDASTAAAAPKAKPAAKEEAAPESKPKLAVELKDPRLAAAYEALNDVAGFLAIPDKDANAFDGTMLAEVEAMQEQADALEAQTPEPSSLMGVADAEVVKTLPIHIRGSYLTLGKPIARGFPEVMRTSSAAPILPAKQSGRLELARWMASSEHPLTARVAVNRLWRWHFGSGIVPSTENFGVLGDKPTHPALLDWLARRFIEEGWSMKAMHRLLMKSAAYQQSSSPEAWIAANPKASANPLTLDPENRLLWRFSVRRLEAEELRDAMLAASRSLSFEVGGKTLPLRNRQFVFNHTSKDRTSYETPRRALYIPIVRNHLYDLLEQFDYPDPTMPTGSRNATVVAPQALIMLNAPIAAQAAASLARYLQALPLGNDQARLSHAYATVFARPASAAELQRAEAFIQAQPQREQGWTLLCHTLLASNEFAYLR